ncbi:dihydrolipoamide acetyltransferase family protein [Cereibacter sphaeroides]|uniref:dihydrolipoamide acetyltransferase family protein n=1 Tax=Cereibacter sphaeroides TaxID=1063 RepID=UPI001F3E56A7|nr:dihydrolipoamide acetyltransferase family protein [Cereibacter sphaeroides]MCE6967252.1 2-oxo acid dehydrogenase subunit E2 [Cereibacter sphaeroides]
MPVFRMPSLGADMEAGKLVQWLVSPGQRVKRGDIVAVVETQKGAIEIEVFEDGVVEELSASLGQTLPVGAALAVIRGDGEDHAPEIAAAPSATPELAGTGRPEPAPVPAPPAGAAGLAASPAARAEAARIGIDLSTLHGSGPGGAIVLADLPGAELVPAAPQAGATVEGMRSAIGAAMSRSKREIPHYYVSHTSDLDAAAQWLAAWNAPRPPKERVLLAALMARAIALSAREVPELNGHFGSQGFTPASRVHLGLAVALRGGGLVAPAIADADTLTLAELMAAMRDVTLRARTGRLRSWEMTNATITFSSLGETGVDAMAGIIVPPQVAMVTAGTPRRMALVRDKAAVAALAATLTLSADHRVSDGRIGARFLALVDRKLQHPEAL